MQSYRVNLPDVIDEDFDDEFVLVNLRTGTYFSLNRPASLIWNALSQNFSRAVVLARMERLYAVDAAHLARELDTFLAELVAEQLIVPTTGAPDTGFTSPDLDPTERQDYIAPRIEKFSDMQALLVLDPIHQVDATGWPATKVDAH